MAAVPATPIRRAVPWKRVGCFGLLAVLIALPYVLLWEIMVAVADRPATPTPAYSPASLPPYSPPPSPSVPPRHPPANSDPGPGYVWVRGHQHGSKWVEGYWRRKPGYVVPLPAPEIKPSASPQ